MILEIHTKDTIFKIQNPTLIKIFKNETELLKTLQKVEFENFIHSKKYNYKFISNEQELIISGKNITAIYFQKSKNKI